MPNGFKGWVSIMGIKKNPKDQVIFLVMKVVRNENNEEVPDGIFLDKYGTEDNLLNAISTGSYWIYVEGNIEQYTSLFDEIVDLCHFYGYKVQDFDEGGGGGGEPPVEPSGGSMPNLTLRIPRLSKKVEVI